MRRAVEARRLHAPGVAPAIGNRIDAGRRALQCRDLFGVLRDVAAFLRLEAVDIWFKFLLALIVE